ncbi:MAG: BrnT family toxin [Chlamydiae bacterium]|nr:BrnT family toxin [Chlamydiota bacterium]MBI3267100.1 BrnT family toxin [Chlamydiota bacterium]
MRARALSRFDPDHSQEEDRWITLGIDQNGILLVVCHAFHETGSHNAYIRIISARKATKTEIKQYL